jgi:arylsulfatase A-like enzyme
MPLTERLLPQYLAECGYATGMVGKWRLGALPQFHPLERGFGEFFGFLHAAIPYVEAGTAGMHFADRGQRRGGGEPKRGPAIRGTFRKDRSSGATARAGRRGRGCGS